MEHNQETNIEPIKSSLSKFGVEFENQFVVLDDAKHVMGFDLRDPSKLILENVENGKVDKIKWSESSFYAVTTLLYDEDTGFLYSGDRFGQLHKYKVDTASKTCKKVKGYGDQMGSIWSLYRFSDFVFIGGCSTQITVLDLSTDELLPGFLKTSLGIIYSLKVCAKSKDEIYLAASGKRSDDSKEKPVLFDMSSFLLNDSVIHKKLYLDYTKNQNKIILEQRETIQTQKKKMRKLMKEIELYKKNFKKMKTITDDLKNKNDQLLKKKNEISKKYFFLKIKTDNEAQYYAKKINILYHHKSRRTTIGNKMSLFGNRWFDETDPLVVIRNLKEDMEEQKYKYKKLESSMYDVLAKKKIIEQESEAKDFRINALQNQMISIREVVALRYVIYSLF